MTPTTNPDIVRQKVREGYGQIARGGGSCCGPALVCCGSAPVGSDNLTQNIGYSAEFLGALPEGANMGLACGNPNALAQLQPGEVVLGGYGVLSSAQRMSGKGREENSCGGGSSCCN